MRIEGRGKGWVVLAEWYGAERVVFSGNIYECCHWMADQEEE